MTLLAPSLMAGNPMHYQLELAKIINYADIVHLDVMDGHFVPNLGLCLNVCESVCKESSIPCYAHLMVTNPADYRERLRNMGCDCFVWHIESRVNHAKLVKQVKDGGMKAGIAISPGTRVSRLKRVARLVDMITVMGVYPGRSGQKFIDDTIKRVNTIRKFHGDFLVEVDGGVNESNAIELIEAGADILVSGSSFFNSNNKRDSQIK